MRGANNPSLFVMERRVEAVVKTRMMGILMNIARKNINIGQEQFLQTIRGLNGKAEQEMAKFSCEQEKKKQEEKDIIKLRQTLFNSSTLLELNLEDKQICARILGANMYAEKSSLSLKLNGLVSAQGDESVTHYSKSNQDFFSKSIQCLGQWQTSNTSIEARNDARYAKIVEREKWGGLTYPCPLLLSLFEKLTLMFQKVFAASRQQNEGIEELPKILKGLIEEAVSVEAIHELGLLDMLNRESTSSGDKDSIFKANEIAIITLDSVLRRWFYTTMRGYEASLRQAAAEKSVSKVGDISSLRSYLKTHQMSAI